MFSERKERLDWQLITEVEPLVLEAGAPEELDKLTRLMAGLAHCSLEAEFSKEALENTRGLAKLFRLAQLSIQTLLTTRADMERALEEQRETEAKLNQTIEKLNEDYKALVAETKALRKESKKRRKMLVTQQESMFKGLNLDFIHFIIPNICVHSRDRLQGLPKVSSVPQDFCKRVFSDFSSQ